MQQPLHIIMPVKDAIETCTLAIEHLIPSLDEHKKFTVYNDFSTEENTHKLQALADQYGFSIIHWHEHTEHPSPNYLLTLQTAQQKALEEDANLLIIESDVLIKQDTIQDLLQHISDDTGMVASVTVDKDGNINFPYLYARKLKGTCIETEKRLSFCCTLLTNQFLKAYSFELLDSTKNWYDVFISHKSTELGFKNRLLLNSPVVHLPHASRPWKQLKYTNPILYYWRKITQRLDKI